MRVQIQEGSLHNYSCVAVNTPDRGVTALQIRTSMQYLYNSYSNAPRGKWIPASVDADLKAAIIRMSQKLTDFVSGGGVSQGGNIWRELVGNTGIRLDLENLRGHNLRW